MPRIETEKAQPVRIAIVGLGRWGRNYLKTLIRMDSCRISALVDTDPQVRTALASVTDLPILPDIEALLERPEPDAVIVATPDHTHVALTRLCLEADRDVLVEKPLARTARDAALLVSLARTRGLVLACGHTALYQPGFTSLLETVRSGRLGKPVRIESVRTSSGPGPAKDRRLLSENGYGPLWDLAPHDVAMVIKLFGPPKLCRPACDSNGKSAEFELLFAEGVTGRFRVAWHKEDRTRNISVIGPLGSFTLKENSAEHCCLDDQPLARQCLDFIECSRDRAVPQSDAELGLAVTRCLEQCSMLRARCITPESAAERQCV